MNLTSKQIEIMMIVVHGNKDGDKFTPCDLDQIIERLSYHPTKDAIQFSIRNLISKGLIKKAGTENRRDRRRVLIAPTEVGLKMMSPPAASSEDFLDLEAELD